MLHVGWERNIIMSDGNGYDVFFSHLMKATKEDRPDLDTISWFLDCMNKLPRRKVGYLRFPNLSLQLHSDDHL